jgi:penicillin-binding protein 1A
MRIFSRTLITVVVAIVVGGVAVGACLAALIPGTVEIATAHHYTAEQVGNLKALAQPSTIYWADGTTSMGSFGLQARNPISSLNEVPKMVQDAIIATEDRSFWTNDGIDVGAVFRAALTNLTSGRIEQGGSTITQQLVKNRILTSKRDVNRKIKEIEDALRLNDKFSKEKIFVEYLNTVYFGSGSYGIKAAASRFFYTVDPGSSFPRGKRLDELTIGEAALLAGLISNPEGNNPFSYPDRAIRRRADVLRGMVDEHYISQAQADAANNEPLPTIKPPPNPVVGHDFLQAQVLQDLLQNPALGNTEKERADKVLKGGLKIYTTFDQNLQNMAVAATDNAKPQMGTDWVSSLTSIDPSTGAVKAMVSGQDFTADQTNIASSPYGRQTGSTFKVITLAAALENGYSPADTVDGSSPCSVAGFDGFTQNDEPGSGTYDLWGATAGSINCAFVRLSTSVGLAKVIDLAHKMGITKDNLQPYLTLTLGVFGQNTETMADVMSTIASGGTHHAPYTVQKIVGPEGRVVFDQNTVGDQVLDPAVAACEQNVLRGVVTGGTGTKADVPGHLVFGKTGTTDSLGDAWFIGATPQLATAVWFGNYHTVEPGAGFGGDSAAPVFQAFMSQALADEPPVPLPDPGPVCARPGQQVIDTGGRTNNAPPVPQLPTVQQQPTTPNPSPAAPTAPAATTPTTPPATSPPSGGGGGHGNGNR